MKNMKKFSAIVLAIVMVLMYAVPVGVFAIERDETHTISVNSSDTHKYRIFQVLTGTLSVEGSSELGDPQWGDDAIAKPGDINAFITSITKAGLSEAEIGNLVKAKVDTSGEGQGTVDKDHPKTGLKTGYYILVDESTLTDEDGRVTETKSLNVLKVVNDINGWEPKWDTVTDSKKITTDTLGKIGSDTNTINGDKDNVSVGDTVNYEITAAIPAKAKDYNYFYFVITDKLDEGLDFQNDIKVYKGSVNEDNLLTAGNDKDYILKTGSDAAPYTFQIGLVDAKALGGTTGTNIIVTYSAKLNKNAQLGDTANKNTSTVKFSNDPNHTYNGDTDNPSPGFPATTDQTVMGETPDSITKTYTTGIEIQKVDNNGKPLTGVKFKLEGSSLKEVVKVTETFTKDNTNGNWYKLTNGKYTQTEPTDDTMVKTDGATEGYVVETDAAKIEITVNEVGYRAVTQDDLEANVDVYVLKTGTASQYEKDGDVFAKYVKGTTTNSENVTEQKEIELEVDKNGRVSFDGLGAGVYTITETEHPAGYNEIAPFNITIAYDKTKTGENAANTQWNFTATGDNTGAYSFKDGVYKMEIVNNKGTELPTTGGIGTTIFYILGTLLVLGAGVLLVTRRRMQSEK